MWYCGHCSVGPARVRGCRAGHVQTTLNKRSPSCITYVAEIHEEEDPFACNKVHDAVGQNDSREAQESKREHGRSCRSNEDEAEQSGRSERILDRVTVAPGIAYYPIKAVSSWLELSGCRAIGMNIECRFPLHAVRLNSVQSVFCCRDHSIPKAGILAVRSWGRKFCACLAQLVSSINGFAVSLVIINNVGEQLEEGPRRMCLMQGTPQFQVQQHVKQRGPCGLRASALALCPYTCTLQPPPLSAAGPALEPFRCSTTQPAPKVYARRHHLLYTHQSRLQATHKIHLAFPTPFAADSTKGTGNMPVSWSPGPMTCR